MGLRKAQAGARINALCKQSRLSHTTVYWKSRKVLDLYKDAKLISKKDKEYEDRVVTSFLDDAKKKYIEYLKGEGSRTGSIDECLLKLLGTEWADSIITSVVDKIQEFDVNQNDYIKILNLNFCEKDTPEDIIMDELSLSRSTYFRRKKEATVLFGILLWNTILNEYIIPEIRINETKVETIIETNMRPNIIKGMVPST